MKANKYHPLPEYVLLDARSDLFYEMHTTGDVKINSVKHTVFDFLEYMDSEEKDNVFSMLVKGNNDAKEYALGLLSTAFNAEFNDEVIENHIIDEACEYNEL